MSAAAPTTDPPPGVLAAWDLTAGKAEPLAGGLINRTFLVRDAAGEIRLVLQALHPVFAAEVNLDIEAITEHLAAAGLATPRLVRTTAGEPCMVDGGVVWRALTFIEGVSLHAMPGGDHAEAAGSLVGRFHRALADLVHDFAFQRAGVHDTAAHLRRLAQAIRGESQAAPGDANPLLADATQLGREILDAGARLPPVGDLPRRILHGDLKVSNILFAPGTVPVSAVCLIDLDTMGRQTIAYEMGDALRSWCNPAGEDTTDTSFDLDVFTRAVGGYAAGLSGLLAPAERTALIAGIEIVAVELAARFCVDAFDDRYFGWDPTRFASRRHHNLVRARGQLNLARAVAAERAGAAERIAAAFG